MNDTKREPDRRSPADIQRDIDHTRSEMDRTAEALRGRLTPGGLVDELWRHVRHETGGNVGDVFREHPVPFALMGLGLGWLAVEQRSSRAARVGPGERSRDVGRWPREKAQEIRRSLSGSGDSREGDGDSMGERAAESASEAAEWTRGQARRQSQRVREGAGRVSRMFDENPVALGALALGLGLASGVSVRSSQKEDRIAGPMADEVKGEARRAGEEVVEGGRQAAGEATSAAGDDLEPQERRASERPDPGSERMEPGVPRGEGDH